MLKQRKLTLMTQLLVWSAYTRCYINLLIEDRTLNQALHLIHDSLGLQLGFEVALIHLILHSS